MYWLRTVTKIPRVSADDISPWWTTCQKREMHSRGGSHGLERQTLCSLRGRHAAPRRGYHPQAAGPGFGLEHGVRSGSAAPAQAFRVRRLPGRDGVRRQGGRGGRGGAAPSRLLRPLQPRRRDVVDSRRRAACPKTTSYSRPRSTVSWRDAGRSRDRRRDRPNSGRQWPRRARATAFPCRRLVRNTARGADLLPSAKLHAWDATRGSPPADAFDGVDVVINLMGEPIGEKRWSDARKKQLRDSRVVGTRALVDALRDLPRRPRLLISASGAGYYGDRGDEILTESASVGDGVPRRAGARLGGGGDARRRHRAARRGAAQRRGAVEGGGDLEQDVAAVPARAWAGRSAAAISGCLGFTSRITSASCAT